MAGFVHRITPPVRRTTHRIIHRMRVLTLLLALFSAGLLLSQCRPVSAYTAHVDPRTQFETWEGWGTSLCWFANVLGTSNDTYRSTYATLLFDPNNGLGLNIIRYNIGGGENPAYLSPNTQYLQNRAVVPGYEPSNGAYDWTQDANQRWFLSQAMSLGADEQEAFSNSPPYWMTVSGSVTGSSDGTSDNLSSSYYTNFASYLSTVVSHFQSSWGVTFRDVEPFNEPGASWWKFGGNQEGCHFGTGTQGTIIQDLFSDLGSSVTRIAASDENSIDSQVSDWQSFSSTVHNDVYKLNTHSYNGSRRVGFWDAAYASSKPHWMSEYGDGDGTGLTMSEQILKDIKGMQPNGWVYWQAVDDSSASGWGMLYSNLNNPTDYSYGVNEKYYVMKNYSNFIRPGYKIIFCDDGQSLAAWDKYSGKLVIVTTNNTSSSVSVQYSLSNFSGLGASAVPYLTDANGDNCVQLASVAVSSGSFTATVPSKSVETFVIAGASYNPTISATINDNTTGTGTNQFNYRGTWSYGSQTGAYNNDNHWSGNTNDSYSVVFNGTQIILYAAHAPQHGIAGISIDGGPETDVDFYAATRVDNIPCYESPTLPSGSHTLKVRVTGRKNANASYPIVPADRVDVITGQPAFVSGAQYILVNRNSGDDMDVNGASTSAGAYIIQWPDNGGSNQHWKFSSLGSGLYNITNVNSGLLVDVNGASTSAGAYIIQWSSNGGNNQKWTPSYYTGPFYTFVNYNSGLLLDVNGASLSDGTQLIQWSSNGGWNQQWAVRRVN